jgi:uncharacterized FlaG/YvyC family protein
MAERIDPISSIGAYGSMEERGSGRRNKYGSAPTHPESPPAVKEASAEATNAAAPSPETLQSAVQRINEHLASLDRALELRKDAATGLTTVIIRHVHTGEILQQIPAGNGAQLAQMLTSWSYGGNVLFDLIA